MMPKMDDETLARALWEDTKAQAIGIAKLRGHGFDQQKFTPEEELLMWNTTAKGWTIEQELTLLSGVNADGTPAFDPKTGQPLKPKSREEVGMLKFPHRVKLMTSGERVLDKYEQMKYAAKMAQKSDPMWQPYPTAKEPPMSSSYGAQPPTTDVGAADIRAPQGPPLPDAAASDLPEWGV